MAKTAKDNVTGKASGAVGNTFTLDADNPLPIEINSNVFVNLTGKKYVPFLNPTDNFAQLLTEAKLLSPTTNSCVSSKAQYCRGGGIAVDGDQQQKDIKALMDWGASVNRKQESLNEILQNGFGDRLTSGNAYIQVIKGEVGKKRFVRVWLREFQECRLSTPDDDDVCNSVYVSKYFLRRGMWSGDITKCEEIPIWTPYEIDQPWAKDKKGNYHTMFHLRNKTSGYSYYGLPSNVGSLPNQLLEYKAARYNLDNFENNLVIGGVICVKAPMTDEEAKKIGRDLVYQHSGDGKRGRWMILNNASGIADGIQIEHFTKQEEGSYIESDQHNEEKIYTSNQWNKLLIGGSEKKGMGQGNSAYIRSVFDIANSSVIQPEQEYMVTKFLKPLMRICDDWMGTNWSGLEVGIKQLQPISFLGDVDVNSLLTVDEGRAILGMDPLGGEEGGKLISAATKKEQPIITGQPDKPQP